MSRLSAPFHLAASSLTVEAAHAQRRPIRAAWLVGLGLVLGAGGCGHDLSAPDPIPPLAVAVSPPSVEVAPGDSVSLGVSIQRGAGATDAVTLEMLGLPQGVTVGFGTNPLLDDTATVTLHAGVDAAAGAYPVTLRAGAAAMQVATATIDLRIAPPRVSSVEVPFCGSLAPVWVAFQDGDGTWQRAEADIALGRTTFRHDFSSHRAAIATVTPLFDGAITVLRIVYGAPSELAGVGDTLRLDCSTTSRTWHGTVTGLQANEKAVITSGQFQRASVLSPSGEYSLPGLPAEPQDVLLTRLTQVADASVQSGFILRRGVNAVDGAELPPFDVMSTELFRPATATLTILGAGVESVFSLTDVYTANSRLSLPPLEGSLDATARPYYALPDDRLLPGDLQTIHLATGAGPNATNRTADVFFRSPTDRTVALGAPMVPPTITLTTSGSALLARAVFPHQAGYDQATTVVFDQPSVATLVAVTMTDAYASRQADGYSLAIPDLTTVPGFDPGWRLRPGASVTWSASRIGGTIPFGTDARAVDGSVRRTARVAGIIQAP